MVYVYCLIFETHGNAHELDDAAGARRAPYDGDCLPDPVRIQHSVRHQEGFASRTRLVLSSEKKQS